MAIVKPKPEKPLYTRDSERILHWHYDPPNAIHGGHWTVVHGNPANYLEALVDERIVALQPLEMIVVDFKMPIGKEPPKETWHECNLAKHLATTQDSPWYYRQNFTAVPNVSWGFNLGHEADLLVCSKAGYLTEIEIKVTATDWKADRHKDKFGKNAYGVQLTGGWASGKIKNFYYCAPAKLAARWAEFGIPDWAGVIAVDGQPGDHYYDKKIRIIRQAKASPAAKKLTPEQKADLARLGAMRSWD